MPIYKYMSHLKSSLSETVNKFKVQIIKARNHDVYRNTLSSESGNSLIGKLLESKKPLMTTRFGSTELLCVRNCSKGSIRLPQSLK